MRRREREAILRNVPLAPRPGEEDAVKRLEEDLADSPVRGRPLHLRLRNFRPSASAYLGSLGGPLPYMTRLREIADATSAHEAALESARGEVLAETVDLEAARQRWAAILDRWSFDEVNDLIDRHNRWYPVESRLPMDPRTGDYALVNGTSYRLDRLGAAWARSRFPI